MLAIKTLNEKTSYKKEKKTEKLNVLLKFKYLTIYLKERLFFLFTALIVKIF